MIAGLPLAFAQPLVLLGLASLPVLWWLLRLVPPRPRRQKLGPEKLLLDILPKEETPARTPWWLTLLRLTLAALLIFAAAGPQWNPPLATAQASAPLALLIDDGWAAAATWDTRLRTAEDLIARAETDNRGVAIIPLSDVGRDISLETPGAARVRLRSLKQSIRLLHQAIKQLPDGAFIVDDPRVALPPKRDTYNTIEAMIRHFKHIVDGIKVPAGEAYTFVEGGNGELGFFIVADGTGRPYKCYCRSPSFVHLSTASQLIHNHLIADIVPIFGMINMIGGECDK